MCSRLSEYNMTITDQHYIDLVTSGDTKAFTILVDRYKDFVFTLALKLMKNREDAEEVAQDAFVKAYRSLDRFKGNSKFSTWIYKIVYNTSLDRIKKNKKFRHDVAIDEFTVHQLKSIDNALDCLELEERNRSIKECIDLLPSDDGFLLTLYYFEELSIDEISKIMGITSNHVKVKVFRSRKRLATLFRARLEPEIIEHYE